MKELTITAGEQIVKFYKEAELQSKLDHPNIVKIVDADIVDGTPILVFEYLRRGSADKLLSKSAFLDIRRSLKLTCDILNGLEVAHESGICHMDIKPGNILIGNRGEGKLGDFGQAVEKDKLKYMSPELYVSHLAPEVLRGEPPSVVSDLYAAAVALYRLVNGNEYFEPAEDVRRLVSDISKGRLPDRKTYRPHISQKLKRTINKALRVDPQERFQDALKMRRALEAVDIDVNWRMRPENGMQVWLGSCEAENKEYRVELWQARSGQWVIQTATRRIRAERFRRITGHCMKKPDRDQAELELRKILLNPRPR